MADWTSGAKRISGSWRLLWPALLLSGAGYVGLALWFPLRPNLAYKPAADILFLAHSLGNGLAYAGLLILLFILLLVAVRGVWLRGVWPADSAPAYWRTLFAILAVTALFGLPLVFTFPINATDIFRYGLQGRISSSYVGNPFVEPLTNYSTDPLFSYAGKWVDETTPYGPVWESAAGLITQASSDSVYGTLVGFKGFGLFLLLATSVVLWQLLSTLPINRRAAYVVLWAWNPALLLSFVAQGHNDALMLFWLLLGMLAMQRSRPVAGLSMIVIATLTKPIALLMLPIFMVSGLEKTIECGRKSASRSGSGAGVFDPYRSGIPPLGRKRWLDGCAPGTGVATVMGGVCRRWILTVCLYLFRL